MLKAKAKDAVLGDWRDIGSEYFAGPFRMSRTLRVGSVTVAKAVVERSEYGSDVHVRACRVFGELRLPVDGIWDLVKADLDVQFGYLFQLMTDKCPYCLKPKPWWKRLWERVFGVAA